ncbi:MAG: amidase [Chloroflexota bacterium]|jgi:aspartyl-tRNA(Asn)/glutamyl-tRNA(Gln) amidotransferase subunit A|nr:Asp-tRNA(Asn)/Glu-tRNA(Gln) amidotransferase GatCAB subunit A [Dehalococcoidia bacterium]MED5569768.1 amidase [Chloroflexota bacterium]|tara:strand:+ start:723 stop:2129 length:1407 start_codon:yes stop_codon:yes gene_type:complete
MTTSQTNLYHLTIREASALLKSGQLSPVELTQSFLDRIEATDDRLHSFIIVLKEQALDDARLAEAEIRRGDYKGPLHGIPFALKDLYDTAGITTTSGSKVDIDRVPTEDATTTARLKAAGGILLGKLAMHEFALGGPDFTTPFPPARNPWNLAHITGGSSSGSGAAVASGQAMAALGSCTGGSIRGPASLCGIVGLKATYGRVSRAGVVTLSWSQDHCGPMTWTVEDTAYMMQALAGYDPKDPTTSTAPVPDYSLSLREDIKGLTIGVPRHFFFAPHESVNPEVVATVEKGLKVLEGLGANLQEVTIPSLEYVRAANSVIMLSEAFAYHEKNLQTRPHDFGEMVRARFRIGGLFSASDYVQSQRIRKVVNRECAEVLQKVDVLVTPTMTQPAAAFEGYDATSNITGRSFTAPFNLTGLPAISVPCGFTASGLPVGMQIAGKPFDEPGVIRAAYAYQQEARWFEQRPSI